MATRPHPLHFIKPSEIEKAAQVISRTVQARKNANASDSYPIIFKSISLHEPSKAILLPYLDAESEGVPVAQRPFVPRLATVVYSLENDRELFESVVSLDTGIEVVLTQAAKGQHSPFDR